MSDTEEVELSKEERLEAAKKKFEELKKKNKKKSKKSKKLKKDEEKEDTPVTEDATSDNERKEEEEKVDDVEQAEETKESEAKVESEETKEEPKEEPKEVSEEVKEEAKEYKDKGEIIEESKAESKEVEKEVKEDAEVKEQVELVDLDTKLKPEPSWLEGTEESSKSWLDEIQESEKLKQEETAKDSLQDLVTKQAKEILDLKTENTDLRMNKFELLEKIESLELHVKKLNAKLNMKKIDQPIYQSDYNSELSLSPEPFISNPEKQQQSGFIKTPSFQNFQDSTYNTNYADSSGDLRDRLLRWKDWQLDMRAWRSASAGPVVEI